MISPDRRAAAGRLLAVWLAAASLFATPPAGAQDKPKAEADKASGVFDGEAKPADAKDKDKDKEKAKDGGVSDRDKIGFTQENVAAQMTEVEERMFRLSEALRSLEPENASRLRLALKFSREEQILEQMRESNKLLKDAQLGKAETEVRELLAKLEHLRDLLLAEDLDFQLKLARLRQMRETLGRLERIVKDQKRQEGWSRYAVEQRKLLERQAARRPGLEAVVRDQEAVVADARAAAVGDGAPRSEALAAVRGREAKLRGSAGALASDPLFADLQPPHLARADPLLADALAALEAGDAGAAVAAGEKALEQIRAELGRLADLSAQAEKAVGPAEFRRREADQAKDRGAADALAEASARLGDAGVALRKDLIRAAASMRGAEKGLAGDDPGAAADEQSAALETLAKSGDDLGRSVERLLVEIRTELQSRLITELAEVHEVQSFVRETTEAQAPRVAKKSRAALIAVAGLSKTQAEAGERTERLLALVEETEFGIALPTTLRVLAREMRDVEGRLKAGDVGGRTVATETRLVEDLLGLLPAVRRLPPTTPPAPGTPLPSDTRQRERELNRLVAELKMVRMLQARLNDDTAGVDKTRPGNTPLSPDLRRELEALESGQDEVRDALAKIAERLPNPNEPE